MNSDRQEIHSEEDENAQLLRTEYAESKYSICILVLYGLLCLSIGVSYSNYAAIAPQIQQLYGLSVSFMNLTNSAFFAMSIIFFLPSIYSLSYCSLRFNVWTMVVVSIVGAWVECFINHSFVFAFIGSYIIGISFAFLKSIVTRISSIWFAPNRRVISTSIMYSTLFTVDLLSLNFPLIFLNTETIPKEQEPHYRGQVLKMHLSKAIISTLCGVLVILFFREKPSKPVAPTVMIPRLKLRDTLSRQFKHWDFWLLGIFLALIDSTADVSRIIVKQAFGQYGVTSKMVGIAGIISAIVSLIAVNSCGVCSSRLRQIKLLLLISGVSTLFILALTLIFIKLQSAYGLMLLLPAQTLTIKYVYPLVNELAGEIFFPIPEAFSGSSLNFILKIVTFSLIQISSVFINHNSVPQFIWLLIILQIVATLAVYFVEQNFKRRNTDETILRSRERHLVEKEEALD